MAYVQNLFVVRNADFVEGMPFRRWENRTGKGREKVVESFEQVVYIGDEVGPYKIVSLNKSNQPQLEYKTKRVLSGSFAKQNLNGHNRLVISGREKNDTAIYVWVRTGLEVEKDGPEGIELAIDKFIMNSDSNFFIPGSFSLDGQSSLESADAGMSAATAQKLKGLGGKGHKLIGGSAYRHDLWRIALNKSVLVQEVNGMLYRIVNEDGGLALKDANTAEYAELFMDFVAQGREAAAKAKAAYRVSRQEKESNPDPVETAAAVSESVAVEPPQEA